MEPNKCEGWRWGTLSGIEAFAIVDEEKLFLPIRNLLKQRPEVWAELRRKAALGETGTRTYIVA